MCRRLESEEEKVLPFYMNSLNWEEQKAVDKLALEKPVEPLAQVNRLNSEMGGIPLCLLRCQMEEIFPWFIVWNNLSICLKLICIFRVYWLAFTVPLPGGIIRLRQRLIEVWRVYLPELGNSCSERFSLKT